jgi:hypothetical protein
MSTPVSWAEIKWRVRTLVFYWWMRATSVDPDPAFVKHLARLRALLPEEKRKIRERIYADIGIRLRDLPI